MHWSDIIENFDFLMNGLVITLQVASISVAGSLILGIVLGIIRHSKIFPLNIISVIYIELIRSTPLILFIVFIHFGLLPAIFGGSTSVFQSTYIALIIFTSAYIAEITRGGLKSIETGYIEASKSLGLSYFQRLFYVILPLAITRMTPAFVSQFISLIKDTSLASAIGLIELTRSGEIIYERTYHEFEILIFIALMYFTICYGLSTLSKKLELKPNILTEFEKIQQN
ncbi:MAG: hypothetical protein A2287_06040 [Candidatus Melainabacteria bacterium RIFOXYA12_FULL_32_12]|nr:MAG: hypothetical protein A2255_06515 [Candidatus Melainabacteria bacterium RIFOXYA2_FULL_32_9]OGI28934.1 MAG: hypothetical protein A2287_06040 [Candidatus Melainabacteria bacterium RIFOXYA12_FULL_32_12]